MNRTFVRPWGCYLVHTFYSTHLLIKLLLKEVDQRFRNTSDTRTVDLTKFYFESTKKKKFLSTFLPVFPFVIRLLSS